MKKILFVLVILILHSTCFISNSSAQTQLWSTATGFSSATGAIFKINLDGSGYSAVQKILDPYGSLVYASDGKLYGLLPVDVGGGGIDFYFGYAFSFDPAANAYNENSVLNLKHTPYFPGSLIQATNGILYGMSPVIGNNLGCIFSINPFKELFAFSGSNGTYPFGSLMQASNGLLYGMTQTGGSYNDGVIFSFDPSTNTYSKLHDFNDTTGANPMGSLMQASNGKLYGMTSAGGSVGLGVIFSFDPSSNAYSDLLNLNGVNGSSPSGNLIQASNAKLYGMTTSGGSSGDGVLFSFDLSSSNYDYQMDFNGSANGATPYGSLMQASNGKLYAMTEAGGSNNDGVIFNFDPSSNLYTKLRDLFPPDAIQPYYSSFIEVALTIATDSVSSTLCSGSSVTIPYSVGGGIYNADNIFTAQLSDSTGSFASPTNIGILADTTSGTIIATIPSNTPAGTRFRIRVVSSSPVVAGSDNGKNIIINNNCNAVLNLKMFIQGYYQSVGSVTPMDNLGDGGCLYVSGISSDMTEVDTISISLMNPVTQSQVGSSVKGLLHTDGSVWESGSAGVIFPGSVAGNSYYIKITHRSAIETWSGNPVPFTSTTSYDFSTSLSQAYGSNMIKVDKIGAQNVYAFWSGDVYDNNNHIPYAQDGYVDSGDYSLIEQDYMAMLFGYYATDVTGDGIVESADYSLIETNYSKIIFKSTPW